MKITRLRLAGFGPYKNEQLVDFSRFDDDGIFLITGKTGAGKSSILDAICFALYARVPRFDGGELALRSDHCAPGDPTFVELDFSLGGQAYRLYRTPRYLRPKKRGGGTTVSPPDAVLQVRRGDDWVGVAARPVDVGMELSRILPLSEDQFLQVILLAQNRFQKFLLAKTDDRRTVLRTLFGTARFERLETALIRRRKSIDEALAGVTGAIAERAAFAAAQLRQEVPDTAPEPAWFDEGLAALRAQLQSASAESGRAAAELLEAVAGQREIDDLSARQARRDGARARLAVLQADEPLITADRARVQTAARAARVWPQLRAAEQAATALQAARADENRTRARRLGLVSSLSSGAGNTAGSADAAAPPLTAPDVRAELHALLARLGGLHDALGDERRLPDHDAQLLRLARDERAADADLARGTDRLDALPQHLSAAEAEHARADLAAARGAEAAGALARADAALHAARTVQRHTGQLRLSQQAEAAASTQNTQAAAHYEALLTARFDGFSVELATRLVPGEPCTVCGSPEHPHPASAPAAPVTETDLNSARTRMTSCQQSLVAAHAAVQTLSTALAAAQALAGDAGLDELDTQLAEATRARRDADTAAAQLPGLAAAREALRQELASAQTGLVDVRARRDAAVTAHAGLLSLRQAGAARVALHRGDFASIGDQVERLEAERDAAGALLDALDHSRERADADRAARDAAAEQLTAEGFADAAEALAARLSADEAERCVARIRAHDDGRAACTSTLADAELIGLPERPVDRAPADLLVRQAGERRDDALTEHSALGERATQLAAVVADVHDRFAASAALRVEHRQVRQLADVVHGDEPNTKRMRLETFVLAAQLEEIVAAANLRLRTMTSGRYTLEHDDSAEFRGAQSGLGLAIRDEHTGRARATHSLSGGETFLASLALALGLAEVVSAQAGGVTLDTLFVDEGFGSLDGETLETAMGTLDTLRAGGRTIGLISHVESMKEQIAARLSIRVTDQGYSEVVDPD